MTQAIFDVTTRSAQDVGDYTCRLHIVIAPGAPFGEWDDQVTFTIFRPNSPPTANPDVTGTMKIGNTLQFDAHASDPDPGDLAALTYFWSITGPPGSAPRQHPAAPHATLLLDDPSQIGDWTATVKVTDRQGASGTGSKSFTVVNQAPEPKITGTGCQPETCAGNACTIACEVDADQPIHLEAGPEEDPDHEPVKWEWTVTAAPVPAAPPLPSTDSVLEIPTGRKGVGDWTIESTASDDGGEGHRHEEGKTTKTVHVLVKALVPKIALDGPTSIKVGDPLRLRTTVTADDYPDHQPLTFAWDVAQAPASGQVQPQAGYSTDASAALAPTTLSDAGTWILKLTVTDMIGTTADKEASVVVDGPPQPRIQGPQQIGSHAFPLVLDGSGSVDPDSACADRAHPGPGDPCGHNTLSGRAVSGITDGIRSYTWSLVDVPFEVSTDFPLGQVDEVLGVAAHDAKVSVGFGDLAPGDWTFQLAVVDAEGNEAQATHTVEVIDEDGPPTAVAGAPARYKVDALGALQQDVVLDGSDSVDPDNAVSGQPQPGITDYTWTSKPPGGCTSLPAPAAVQGAHAVLFRAGQVVEADCLGYWEITLKVTDDDRPPRTAETTTSVLIGRCVDPLCIDHPTAGTPERVEFADNTDVLVFYELNSSLYGGPDFFGRLPLLEIFHESDPARPVYTDVDTNVLPTDQGGFSVFHWNGYTDENRRPRPGHYTVRITLLDENDRPTTTKAEEADAILLAVADPKLLDTSTELASVDELKEHRSSVHFDYAIEGDAHPDQLRWRVFDAAGAEVHAADETPTARGTITWDGTAGPEVLSPGRYAVELEAFRLGASLGKSPRRDFTIARVDLDVDTDRDGMVDDERDEADENTWSSRRGAIFSVNYDRDGARTDSGTKLPDAIVIGDDGKPTQEDRKIDNAADEADITPLVLRRPGTPLPDGWRVFLKAGDPQDVAAIHVYGAIKAGETAFWGGIGGPEPLEVEITDRVRALEAAAPGAEADLMMGIEGLLFRSMSGFTGEINLSLEVRKQGQPTLSDSVRLKVAPWLLLPHTQPSTDLWAADLTALLPNNASFIAGLTGSGQLKRVPFSDAKSQWLQDHVETGFYQRPGGPKTVCTLRMPYPYPGPPVPPSTTASTLFQPPWPVAQLLGPNSAVYQVGAFLGNDTGADPMSFAASGTFGGNLELLPPTTAHPLGSIVVGDTMSESMRTFLREQQVQPLVELPVLWLQVGHVDEVMAFTDTPNQVVVADPTDAYAILDAIPAAERDAAVFFAKGRSKGGSVSAEAPSGDRLLTTDNVRDRTWQYVRVYNATGAGASGQVAHVSAREDGFLEVDRVWDTKSKILPATATDPSVGRYMLTPAPLRTRGDPRVGTNVWFRKPKAGDRFVLVEDSQFWMDKETTLDSHPAVVTVAEVLADNELRAFNTIDVQGVIDDQRDGIKARLQMAAGNTLSFVKVPTLYVGLRSGFATNRAGVAFTPGLANLQIVNAAGPPATRTMYFARQFGPRDAMGRDLFETVTKARLPSANFVDDWDVYHRGEGEVHCGSTTRRVPFSFDWWTRLP